MYQIKTYNVISNVGLAVFEKDKYEINGVTEPDALLIRSQNLHRGVLPVSLLAIGRAGAGVNNIPLDKASENGVVVFNSPGANSNAVKELIVAVLIMAARPIIPAIGWVNTLNSGEDADVTLQAESGKNHFRGTELAGKTLGVIGLGAVGSKVADTAKQLGMKVIGYDPNISVEHAWKVSNDIPRAGSISEVLKDSDYVTIHIPYTEKNKDLISAKELLTMKKGAVLLNYSRDGIVEEAPVLSALESGQISQYWTDFASDELVTHENVMVTPHLGGTTEEAEDNCAEMVANTLCKYLETGEIEHSVNFPSVYMPFNSPYRLTLLHQNVPSMVSKIATVLAELNINIANMINSSKGDYAYTMIDVDEMDTKLYDEFEQKCLDIDAIIRVRGLKNPQID
ncbi:D-3-phosphoglycerate dehydrogenase [Paucilactobacillus oligofermentans DSM 15707 = LMG 22743]|uniref:D-3-phosphoglycerate dehydrogenase n=1 Tax=Paucilactobacillus oligofermentans DSM 15707 = LMG 22743 TaxID=1423778 RepID=A0A0R1REX8_9LACO|nr:phosphoglycerate dehydrogenase [Paucilactobacillus oligofermentans]KRL55350.1 D-3-phosphoglycerate dehydrogenase [Paucilactobacillus oligofermentans DSM 15707 = LMG 22743]CUS25659.1 Phosphoglycerate dehydrogenase [Paucilactobacillus oligofermentans DSM 15707 = LMG 22743]